jgi:hypothetical protein
MRIDWIAKLQHLLQVLAFCLAIAAILYGFQPNRPYVPHVVYSVFIGTTTWAIIDLGRHLTPSSAETGWQLMAIRMGPRLEYSRNCRPSWRSTRCRPCCCSPSWKTASSTGWNRRWREAASP